jgi:hypothetical protein
MSVKLKEWKGRGPCQNKYHRAGLKLRQTNLLWMPLVGESKI